MTEWQRVQQGPVPRFRRPRIEGDMFTVTAFGRYFYCRVPTLTRLKDEA